MSRRTRPRSIRSRSLRPVAPDQPGRQPLVERLEQRVVGDVGPVTAERPSGEAEPGLQRPIGVPPPQHREPRGAHLLDEGGGRRLPRRRPTLARREDERAETAFGSLPQIVAGRVPRQRHDLVDGAGRRLLDVGLVEPGRHPDAEVVVAGRRLPAGAVAGPDSGRVEVGHDEERLPGERVAGREGSRRAAAKAESTVASRLGDAVRVGEGEHRPAGREVVAGSSPIRADRQPTPQLAGSPAHQLHGAPVGRGVSRPLVDDQSDPFGDARRQLLRPAAQDIALLEQRGERAGDAIEAALGGGDDHVGEARVDGKLGHGPAGGRHVVIGVDGAELDEEVVGVGQGTDRRAVEEREVTGRRAPQRQLQGEPGQVDRLDLGRRERPPVGVLALGPQAIGDTGRGAPGPPGPLVGRGA